MEIEEMKQMILAMSSGKVTESSPVASSPVVSYPNPSNGVITVVVDNPEGKTIEISVFNTSGQLISTATGNSANFKQVFDLTTYAEGMYSVQTKIGSQSYTNKVIIQK